MNISSHIKRSIIFAALAFVCYVACIFITSPRNKKSYVDKDLQKINKELRIYEKEFSRIVVEIREDKVLQISDFTKYEDKDYGVLFFENNALELWSKRIFVPESIYEELTSSHSFLIEYNNSLALAQVNDIGMNRQVVFFLPLTNQEKVIQFTPLRYEYLLSKERTFAHAYSFDFKNSEVGYILLSPNSVQRNSYLLNLCWFLMVLFLTSSIFIEVSRQKEGFNIVHFSVFVIIVIVVSFIFKYDQFQVFSEYELFGSKFYGNRLLGKSLGHLFFNLLSILCVLGYWYTMPVPKKIFNFHIPKWLHYGLFVLSIPLLFCLAVTVFRSLVLDSSEKIKFFISSSFISYWIVACMMLIGFMYFFFSARQIRNLNIPIRIKLLLFASSSVVSFIVLSMMYGALEGLFNAVWLFIYCLMFDFLLDDNRKIKKLSHVFLIISLTALIATFGLSKYNKIKDRNQLKQLARQISSTQDFLAEYLIIEEGMRIVKEKALLNLINNPFVSTPDLLVRIESQYFLEKELLKYNRKASLVPKENLYAYADIKEPKIELVNSQFDNISYEVTLPFVVNDEIQQVITVFMSTSKITESDSFYAKYNGKEKKLLDFLSFESISYSVIENGKLAFVKGRIINYDLDEFKTMQIGEVRKISRFKENSYVYKSNNQSFVLISLDLELKSRSFVFYSFVFVNIVFVYIVFVFVSLRFKLSNTQFFKKYIANRMQFFILSIVYIAAFIIGLFSIQSMKMEIKKTEEDNYEKKLINIYDEFTSLYKISDEEQIVNDFEEFLFKNYRSAVFDIYLFNKHGRLVYANNKKLFTDNVWPDRINPKALRDLKLQKANVINYKEKVLSQAFTGNYLAVRDNQLNLVGILYLPAFDIKRDIENQKILFDNSLLSTFSFVLAIITIITLFVTNTVTNVLRKIRQRLSRVDIGMHELIEWENKEDEIGLLVSEYNDMVKKLDDNAVILARSERESTWREIAKQVAHEIKNPLTPMQLSIQQLKRTLQDEDDDSSLMRTLNTLMTQISHLNKIADNFSSVAKMDLPELEVVDITRIMRGVYDMFALTGKVQFEAIDNLPKNNEQFVYADKTMLNRVFTNLIKNAEQAITNKDTGKITVSIDCNDQQYIIKVIDNGKGISVEDRAKIFTPNFTTKKSGTGIGLMMSKKIIELHNGTISFVSNPGIETIFTVTLPKYNSSYAQQ